MEQKTQEAMSKLQVLEQNLQQLAAQKQQVQSQLFEVENALRELESATESYKIVGNVMVKTDPKKASEELKERQESLAIRLSSVEKQERLAAEQAQKIRSTVMNDLKKE